MVRAKSQSRRLASTPKYSRLDPGQRREQILDAANALFAERGYDEVSIGAVGWCLFGSCGMAVEVSLCEPANAPPITA